MKTKLSNYSLNPFTVNRRQVNKTSSINTSEFFLIINLDEFLLELLVDRLIHDRLSTSEQLHD